jgi:4-hydroxy-tetrahydrodipicolinate reductase
LFGLNDELIIKKGIFAKIFFMNIAIIGYGRMGHEIEAIAVQRGHVIRLIVDMDNMDDLNAGNLKDVDVAIEFSTPSSALDNISKCLNYKTPVVSGTTGWLDKIDKAIELCRQNGSAFIHSSNFSIGVNLLFMLSDQLAKQIKRYDEYTVSIEEIHHVKKLDAPSGTAITLAAGIIREHQGYAEWKSGDSSAGNYIPIHSVREGSVLGIHTVTWDSEIDTISLKHEAKNRKGLALGAVVAAEFIKNKVGIFTMKEVMGF